MSAKNWLQAIPTAEAYRLNKILFHIQHDPAEEARFFADKQAYIADAEVTDAARTALAETDVGQLYRLGANPYLLRAYCLQLRVPENEYLAALRAVGEA